LGARADFRRTLRDGLTTSLVHPQIFVRVPHRSSCERTARRAPADVARAFDYEGELGVIIGRGGRHIPIENALDHVAGYCVVNEGSVREFQSHNRQFGWENSSRRVRTVRG